MHLSVTDDTMLEVLVQCKAGIVLQGTLWHQISIAHVRIIKIVESWHTETLLHISPQREERTPKGIDIDEKRWCEFRERIIRVHTNELATTMCLVVDKGGQDGTLRLQMLVIDGCRKTHEIRDARGESEIIGVGIELVPFEIITQ